MADASQYLVHPDTGEVGVVPADQVDLAKQRQFTQATEDQIRFYDAKAAAAESPVLSTLKSAALGAAELVAPTSIARSVLGVGAQPESVTSFLAEKILPESMARGFKAAEIYAKAREAAQPTERTGLQAASDILAPVTPTGALVSSGLMTPEQIAANQAEAGMTGQFLSLAAAVLATLRTYRQNCFR